MSLSSVRKPLADPKGKIEDGDKFLLECMTHRRWLKGKVGSVRDDKSRSRCNDDDDDDSLQDSERTDEFESKYNFRFEEATTNDPDKQGQHGIVHYARSSNAAANVLRHKNDMRRAERAAREERKAAEQRAKEEKLKRLEEREEGGAGEEAGGGSEGVGVQ